VKKNRYFIKKVVEEMGGTLEKIIPERNYFYIKINNERIFINKKFVINNSFFSRKHLTNFKDLTYILLKENNIPTPKTTCFYRETLNKIKLEENLKQLSFPIVVKDANGSNSLGVFANIETLEEAKKIILQEIKKYSCLLAQEMIFGKEYRVLILENKAIGVLEMIPPRIFGNGKNTVKELIEKKQEKTKKTPFDNKLLQYLEEQGETLTSIPKENKEIFIRKNSCLSEGGETKDATAIINKEIVSLCGKVAKIVDKKLIGMDIICDDIRKKPSEQNFNVIEANRRPDIYIHYNPTFGKTRNVVRDIIEFILKLKKF